MQLLILLLEVCFSTALDEHNVARTCKEHRRNNLISTNSFMKYEIGYSPSSPIDLILSMMLFLVILAYGLVKFTTNILLCKDKLCSNKIYSY